MAGKKKALSPEEILRASKVLARDVLRESLAELVYEASNGLDRDRIRRFSGLADQAHELLNSEVAVKGGVVKLPKKAPLTKNDLPPLVVKPKKAKKAAKKGSETKVQLVLRVLREAKGAVVPRESIPAYDSTTIQGRQGLAAAVSDLRELGHDVRFEDGGYRLAKDAG